MVVVFLVTKNVGSLVPFYRDILGLDVTRYEPGHSAWFDTGGVQLAIHRPESGDAPGIDYLPDAPTVIWFRPGEGVPATAMALGEAGVEILRPGNASNYLYLRDPEGRLLGFHEPG